MQFSKSEIRRLREVLSIPDFMEAWLDRFYTGEEISLVLSLAEKPLKIDEIAAGWTGAEYYREPNRLEEFLERSCRRGIIGRFEDGRFQPADFHARFDHWALFEGWMDLPGEVRSKLNAWEIADYCRGHADQIQTLKNGGVRDPSLTWPEYVLLPEAEALIDKAAHVYLWPCNCRMMMGRCRNDLDTCIRFTNHRNAGWEISKSRAKQIVIQANQKGLMQNAEIAIKPDGAIDGAICNCCADCCYPQQLASQMDSAGLWPLTRYVAGHLESRCTGCGRCVKRCPFKAFEFADAANLRQPDGIGQKKEKRSVRFDRHLCRGCGVCSTGCPENAIEMIRLKRVESAWAKRLGLI